MPGLALCSAMISFLRVVIQAPQRRKEINADKRDRHQKRHACADEKRGLEPDLSAEQKRDRDQHQVYKCKRPEKLPDLAGHYAPSLGFHRLLFIPLPAAIGSREYFQAQDCRPEVIIAAALSIISLGSVHDFRSSVSRYTPVRVVTAAVSFVSSFSMV